MGRSRSGSDGPGLMAFGMSSSAARRGRRRAPDIAATAIRARTTPEARPIRIALPVESAASTITGRASSWRASGASDAEGSFGRLADGVGTPGRPGRGVAGVHGQLPAGDLAHEPLQAIRCRPQLVLSRVVVLGAVARTLEPLALFTERDPAPEVRALLVQGHQSSAPGHVGGESVVDPPGLVPVTGVVDQVEAASSEVEGLPGALDLTHDGGGGVGESDDRSEPTR